MAEKQVFYSRLASAPSQLLRHPRRIVLQKGKEVEATMQRRIFEISFGRFCQSRARVLEAIQSEADDGEIGIGKRRLRIKTELFSHLRKCLVILSESTVSEAQLIDG